MDNVVSPCVSVCRLDAAGALCLGCNRTMDEIAAWPGLSLAQRRDVLARVAARVKDTAGNGC